jgi:hypothetical protein
MSGARLTLFGPIPHPSSWVLASDAPAGYFQLCSLSITRRETPKIPGNALVPVKDISAAPDDLERLVQAYARCDAAGRAEVIVIAERLAGATS